MFYLWPHCNSFPVGLSGGENIQIGGVRSVERYDWKQPEDLLVGQTGGSANQAKVFREYAVRQGLCGKLVNALKLLANQQEDGDGLVQNIVTNLYEESRKGLSRRG